MLNRFFTRIIISLLFFNSIVSTGFAQCPDIPMSILDGTNGFITEGKAENDELGYAIKGAGDINGDGIDDIVVGAPGVDVGGLGNVGEAYVIFGGSHVSTSPFDISTLDGTNGFVVRGAREGEGLGTSVGIAGDINNDGIDDIIIGGRLTINDIDSVMVIFGRSSGFSASYVKSDINGANGILIESEEANTGFGKSLNYVGDVNGDGIDDLGIAAPQGKVGTVNSAGLYYIIFGTPGIANMSVSSLNGINGFKIEGYSQSSGPGSNVNGAGDINNDGVDDIIIGSPAYNGGMPYSGIASVVFGKSTFPGVFSLNDLNGTNGFSISGTAYYTHLGSSVASAKDFNNDGIEDIIIGAPRNNGFKSNIGKAYVIYGKTTAFSAIFDVTTLDGTNGLTISGDNALGELGTSVNGLSDINGDGITDIIVSALGEGLGRQGAVYVLYGANSHPARIQAYDIINEIGHQIFDDTNRGFSRQEFGHVVSDIGDFNNDGNNDFAIGAIGESDFYFETGRAYVFYGNTYSIDDPEIPTISCPTEVPELYTNSTLPNYSLMLQNVSDNCTGRRDLTFSQIPAQGTLFTDDVEVEVTVYDKWGNSNSCTFWVRRKTEDIDISCTSEPFFVGDIDETDGTIVYGEKAMGRAGFDVNHAGDINGDGVDDFIIGAKGHTHLSTGPYGIRRHIIEGAAYVVFGKSSGFPPNVDLALLDGINGFIIRNDTDFRETQEMGYATSSAGDINGDGIDDIMISDPKRVNEHGYALGEVFIIFGQNSRYPAVFNISNLDGSNGFTVRGVERAEHLGRGIDNVGDVNNDGIDDIALITGDVGVNPGKCHIIYGTNSAFPALITTDQLNGSNGITILGGDTRELNYIARSVAGLGDVNGDGIDDIAIGSLQPEGDKFVIYGSPGLPAQLTVTGLDGTNGFAINHSRENAGTLVNRAGDINNDGFNDVLLGNKYVLFGGNVLPARVDLANLDGTNGSSIMSQQRVPIDINYGGDFNNDGTDDLIMTTISNAARMPMAHVIYGKTTWKDTVFMDDLKFPDALHIDLNYFNLFNPDISTSYAGDVNSDGIDDIIIGVAPQVGGYLISNPGNAYVIYGRDLSDTNAPDIVCPDDQLLSIRDVLPDYTALATASDECTQMEDIVVSQSPLPGSAFTPGMTITLTATDLSGNSSTCTFRVNTNDDTEAPSITCPGDQELACDVTTLPDYTTLATVTDNEDPSPTVTQSPVAGTAFTPGMTITLTASDASGNENTCTFTVNESADTEDPSITCPGDQGLALGATLPDYTSLATVTDNCDSDPDVTQSPSVGSAFTDGMTVTLTATDASGNENTCTFVVNQSADTEAPSITCPGDQDLACDVTTLPDYTTLATVTDNEDPSPTVTQSPVAGTAFTPGMTITLTASDASGNENTCTFTVNESADAEDPSITCPGDQELAFGATLPDYTSLATVTDNCDSDPDVTQSPSVGSAFTDGMTVTLTATDASGNENTCTFVVNQSADTEAPAITCPGDQELACDVNTLPDYTSLATVTDNEDPSPSVMQSPVAGTTFLPGMTVTLTATDASGNENSCTFIINKSKDQDVPVLHCPGEQEVVCGDLLPNFTDLIEVEDNCSEAPVLSQFPAPGMPVIEETLVTITARDASGNETTCSFTVQAEADFTVDAGFDKEVIFGDTVVLEAFSTYTGEFTWNPAEYILGTNKANPVMAMPEQSVTYSVILRREDGCSATDDVRVEVREREGFKDKYGFSPDGDGINETWEIIGLNDYPENKVSVFNKWGQLVFETENYHNSSNAFDGNANRLTEWGAGELPEGTYYFLIQFPNDAHESVNGFIVIKR